MKKKIVKDVKVKEQPSKVEEKVVEKPIEKKVEPKVEVKQELKAPVTLQDHLDSGWVNVTQSGKQQEQGKKVIEIKNVEGETLHRLED